MLVRSNTQKEQFPFLSLSFYRVIQLASQTVATMLNSNNNYIRTDFFDFPKTGACHNQQGVPRIVQKWRSTPKSGTARYKTTSSEIQQLTIPLTDRHSHTHTHTHTVAQDLVGSCRILTVVFEQEVHTL